jgi:hypothetical protein
MAASTFDFAPEMTHDERLTLLELVAAVQDAAENDAEVVATLRRMVPAEARGIDRYFDVVGKMSVPLPEGRVDPAQTTRARGGEIASPPAAHESLSSPGRAYG